MPPSTLRDWFELALEQPVDGREAWLRQHCVDAGLRAQLLRMLASDASPAHTDAGAGARLAQAIGITPPPSLPPGARVGPFELGDLLGEGGYARVFHAFRDHAGARQDVALKLLHRSLHSSEAQHLYQRELRALTALKHPSIARLIDAGLTDAGQAWIALELVRGEPITQHAQRRLLGLAPRLRLMVQVCRAVDAAHRSLIVHRDLKPSNVLVTDAGEAKLLDFGIAKLLEPGHDETRTLLPAFTPAYAAPEQRRNEAVGTAADVYALGVLLGELLTGQRFNEGDARTPSHYVHADAEPGLLPAPAAQTRRLLRGDLDNILRKALAADPEQRYASAGALADDLERHLERRPVRAHPPSPWYRARKFVARHRGGVVLTAALLVALLASLGTALYQTHLARQEATRANLVRDFLIDVFDAARSFAPRDERPTPEQLVEQSHQHLANSVLDDASRAQVLLTLGRVDLSLDQFERAEKSFAEARGLLQDDPSGARQARVLLASAAQRAGRHAEAKAAIDAELPALHAEPGPDLLLALDVLSAAEFDVGAPDAALARQREAVGVASTIHGTDSVGTLEARFRLGSAMVRAERYGEAVQELEAALALWRARHAPEDERYVAALTSWVTATDGLGDTAASEARQREVLALARRIYREPHLRIATRLRSLAVLIGRGGERADEAEALLQQALGMLRAVVGADHPELAETHAERGQVFAAQRDFPRAEEAYRDTLAICDRTGLHNETCARTRNNLGMLYYRLDRLDDAEPLMRAALEERRVLFGPNHPTVAFSLSTLSNVAAKRGDGATAVELARESVRVMDASDRAASREAALIRNTLAAALWRAGRHAEALPEIDRSLADWRRVAPDDRLREVMMLVQKAQILGDLGQPDAARAVAEEAIVLDLPIERIPETTRQHLRRYSGRADLFPDTAQAGTE